MLTKYKTVTVRHLPLESGNDGAIEEFQRHLADGLKEWKSRNNLTDQEASQQLRETLLGRLQQRAASLITTEAITKIHGPAAGRGRAALVRSICGEISSFLRLELTGLSGLPLWGRGREFSARDRQIWEMRRTGLSYGRIGRELGLSRNAVQAAYRRERQRCESLCRQYPALREILGACGIILEAVKPAN